MKKRTIREGRMIVFIPKEETMRGMKWVVYATKTRVYRCDIYGNIYSYTKELNLVKKLEKVSEAKGRKFARVRIERKLMRVDWLIANAVFWPLTFEQSDIGHLDGNPLNNRVTNLFIDITPKDLNERERK